MSASTNNETNSSNGTIKGFFRFGQRTTNVREFNHDTNMFDIYSYIYQSFNDVIPSKFHVEFYSFEKRRIFRLDGDLLETINNPFHSNSTDNNQDITNIMDYLQLLVIDDSPSDVHINSDSNMDTLLDTILSNDLDIALLSLPAIPIASNAVISHNNISMNQDTDDDISENNPDENSFNSQNNSQISNIPSNEYQVATEPTEENTVEYDRISFSLDVHPDQRHRYLSDKYNVKDGSPKNGDIAYLQGFKTKEQVETGTQILPRLKIPRLLLFSEHLTLLLYAVYEEKESQMRIWYKNHRKGFLSSNQLEPNAKFFNPFKLVLNKTEWTEDGDYILKLLLLTDLDKIIKPKEEIYRLDEQKTLAIHQAKNIQVSKRVHLKPTRIICVREINNKPFWPSFTLSNYIRPPKKKSQSKALSNSTPVSNGLLPSLSNMNAVGLSNHQQNFPLIEPNIVTTVQIVSSAVKKRKFDIN